jgi:hypothetical protein
MRGLVSCALLTVLALVVCTTVTNGPADAIMAAPVQLVLFSAASVLMGLLVRSC